MSILTTTQNKKENDMAKPFVYVPVRCRTARPVTVAKKAKVPVKKAKTKTKAKKKAPVKKVPVKKD